MRRNKTLSIMGWSMFIFFCLLTLFTLKYVYMFIGVALRFIILFFEIWDNDETYIPSQRREHPSEESEHWIYYNLQLKDKDDED